MKIEELYDPIGMAEIDAIICSLPADLAEQVKEAGARLTGEPAETIDLHRAAYCLLEAYNERQPAAVEAEFDRIEDAAEAATGYHYERLTPEQKQMLDEADYGEFAQTVISLAAQLKQRIQEAQEPTPRELAKASSTSMSAITRGLQGEFAEISKGLQSILAYTMEETAKATPPKPQADVAKTAELIYASATALITSAQTALKGIAELINSDAYKAIKESMAAVAAFIDQHRAEIAYLADATQEVQDLAPYLAIELEDLQKDPAFADLSLQDLLEQGFDADGNPTDSPFLQAIERAKKTRADYEGTEQAIEFTERAAEELPQIIEAAEQTASMAELPHITYHNSKQVKAVTDKLMNVFFSITAPTAKDEISGQRQLIPVKYEGTKSRKEITLFYDFEYNENTLTSYGIPKGFGSYEFFVATALDNLWENGNGVVSFSKILEEMGQTGKPSTEQIQKLAQTLIKGASTTIHIDDLEVQKAWGKKRTYTEFVGPVFPIMIRNERYIASGYVTDGAVKINDFSPFRILAGSLGHLSQWDKKILQLYTGRKTDRYWSVMQFLIREIGWMRNAPGKRGNKILYATLYAHTGDKTTRAKQLTRDMLYRLLDEVFKPTGYITAYKEDNRTSPGVILTVANTRQITDVV